MNPYNPHKKCENIVAQSIMEWESGTSSKSVISCKAHFQSEPQHSEFISEKYGDHTVIRCSGWRNLLNMTLI